MESHLSNTTPLENSIYQHLKELENDPFHNSSALMDDLIKLSSLENDEMSIRYFERALLLLPTSQDIHLYLGFFYSKLNDIKKTMYHYRLALLSNISRLSIFDINVYCNIFMLYHSVGNYKTALTYLLDGIKLYPDDPDLNERLGIAYTKLGMFDLAGFAFLKAIDNIDNLILSKDKTILLSSIYSNYALCSDRNFDYASANKYHELSFQLNPNGLSTFQNILMNLNYQKFNYEDRMKPADTHRKINQFFQKTGTYVFDSDFFNTEKINIGIVSGDFMLTHAVYFFASTFLHHHDKNVFNLTCYTDFDSNIPNINIVDTRLKSTKEVSDMIYKNKTHILIDLSGHTSGGKLDVFKNKPSPIQITYIGYPFTTGINEMDYRITDKICEYDLEVSQPYYTEKLLCLDNCFLCYNPPPYKLSIQELIPDEYINIGCYNRPNKFSPYTLDLFRRILVENTKVKFFFNSPAFREKSYSDSFLLNFPEDVRDRISFIISTISAENHIHTLNQINIQVDTNPYSGTTTTCESLLMGVPILTIYDSETCFHCTNVTSSILKNSNLDYFVCSSPDEVLSKIVDLQSKPKQFWSNFKTEVKSKFINGKVCNKELYLSNITKMFVELFNRHKPDDVYQDFLNKQWDVDWDEMPLQNEELECVIVEPRDHPNLERVIKNFASKLNKYSFTWYCSKSNEHCLDDKLPSEALKKIKRVVFCDDNITISQYNELMTSQSFYASFSSKRILIFQTDAGCLRSNIEDFLKYDYIGAPWPQGFTSQMIDIDLVCGNGGLSLRNPKLMKRICEQPNVLYNKYPEDYFFSQHLNDISSDSICFPKSIEEANLFSSETIVNLNSFGFHAVYKYHTGNIVKELMSV